MGKDTLLTTKEFASRSGLTVDQVTRMLRAEELKGIKQSGRWMIPLDMLETAGRAAEAAPSPGAPGPAAAPVPSTATADRTMTVAEFSARTYLTEDGVRRYLKAGRVQGDLDADGEWWIDAASLDLPGLRHLLRR